MHKVKRHFPEFAITLAAMATTASIAIFFGLPFNLPSGERAAFVGVHYLYPLIALGIISVAAAASEPRKLAPTLFIALPCYAVVLVCHFNLKLWIPHVNPTNWDAMLWSTDQLFYFVVQGTISIRKAIAPVLPLDTNAYIVGYIALFYCSFSYHAFKTPERFRTFFVSALLLQFLGSIAYFALPAVGPFLFQQGVETQQTAAQLSMLSAREANVAGGNAWLAEYGGQYITVGLAAMPSLHAGASFLFLIFAWRYGRVLLAPYSLIFAYISLDAIASRWHYVIDLPVGMALAIFCAWAAHRLTVNDTAPGAPTSTTADQPEFKLSSKSAPILITRLRRPARNSPVIR